MANRDVYASKMQQYELNRRSAPRGADLAAENRQLKIPITGSKADDKSGAGQSFPSRQQHQSA